MKEPCLDCLLRFGTEYTSSCDEYCAYARAIKENKKLKEEIYRLREQLLEALAIIESNDD